MQNYTFQGRMNQRIDGLYYPPDEVLDIDLKPINHNKDNKHLFMEFCKPIQRSLKET